MELDSEQTKIETIRKFMKDTSRASAKAHEVLFDDLGNEHNEIIAAIHLNKAISLVSSAKAIYYSDYCNLENTEVEEVFVAFDEFSSEFLNCLYPSDSHQWTAINYNHYKELSNSFYGE